MNFNDNVIAAVTAAAPIAHQSPIGFAVGATGAACLSMCLVGGMAWALWKHGHSLLQYAQRYLYAQPQPHHSQENQQQQQQQHNFDQWQNVHLLKGNRLPVPRSLSSPQLTRTTSIVMYREEVV